jgi:hypothetical protein
MKKLPADITELFRETGQQGGRIGGKRSLQTMTPEQRRERAKKAAMASVQARRTGSSRAPFSMPPAETPVELNSKTEALNRADQILSRLAGYARPGSPIRKAFYRRDLNWMAEVLLRLEANEPDPLRPTAQLPTGAFVNAATAEIKEEVFYPMEALPPNLRDLTPLGRDSA